jgi:hypothetical protein
MLNAAQIATWLGSDRECGPHWRLVSHRSEAVRIPGHLCDSLASKRQRLYAGFGRFRQR